MEALEGKEGHESLVFPRGKNEARSERRWKRPSGALGQGSRRDRHGNLLGQGEKGRGGGRGWRCSLRGDEKQYN